MNLPHALLLFGVALLAGAVNAVAGGGSFISFPTLIFLGVPAIPANATNNLALWTGLVASGGAYRKRLDVPLSILLPLVLASLIGGLAGAILLLRTPEHTFFRVLPWMLLVATLLFLFAPLLRRRQAAGLSHQAGRGTIVVAACFQLFTAIYGGFFGGGMGIIILAMLSTLGLKDIHAMNALKTILSASINGLAAVAFIIAGAVRWPQAMVMIAGAISGGYLAAHYSLRVPPACVRGFILLVAAGITTYFFFRAY